MFAGTPLIINGTLTNADTEYEITLPSFFKKIMVQARQNAALKISYVEGESGSNYFTIKAGSTYYDDFVRSARSLYVQSPTGGTVIEVLVWSGGEEYAS